MVDVDGERRADVRVGRDGHIAEVRATLEPLDGETIVDCTGCLVAPGGIDVHTHLHLPVGAVHVSDDFASGRARQPSVARRLSSTT